MVFPLYHAGDISEIVIYSIYKYFNPQYYAVARDCDQSLIEMSDFFKKPLKWGSSFTGQEMSSLDRCVHRYHLIARIFRLRIVYI